MKSRDHDDDDREQLLHSRHGTASDAYDMDEESGGHRGGFLDGASTSSGSSSSSSEFSPWPHIFNLANCIVGVSVLAMPFCFQQCGILLAVIMIGGVSVLTKLTCHFLCKASIISRRHSYEALALAALGPTGRRFVELCLLFFLVSSIIAFMVVIGDIGPHVVADYLELEAPTQRLRSLVMVLVMLFVIFPLSLIKDLEKFSIFSSAAVMFYAVFVFRMVLEALPSLYEGKWSVHVVWWRSEGFLTCLPIVCMAMSCQTQLFCVLDCIRGVTAERVDLVISGAVNFCSAMYAGVGLFGYVAFYSKVLHGDVLVELESSFFTQLLKLSFMLSIAISIPLMLFPARIALFNIVLRPVFTMHEKTDETESDCIIEDKSGSELPVGALQHSTFHILTFIILSSNLCVAILIPNVEFILGLTGSLIGSLVSIIIPALMFIAIASKKNHPSVPYAKVCLVIGCFILCASTWATLQADRSSSVVEKPMPKDSAGDRPALKSLERLEEQVLDTNLNISAKLDDIAGLAASGKDKEANLLLVEMKEQQKEQVKLIKKQEQIVEELKKHVETHENAKDEKAAKDVNKTDKISDVKREVLLDPKPEVKGVLADEERKEDKTITTTTTSTPETAPKQEQEALKNEPEIDNNIQEESKRMHVGSVASSSPLKDTVVETVTVAAPIVAEEVVDQNNNSNNNVKLEN